MTKPPFNLYKNKYTKGKYLPKCPVIRNTPEVCQWIHDNYQNKLDEFPNFWDESEEYIMFGISASYVGNIYFHINTLTKDELSRYDNSCIKIFDYDFEAFVKYLNWALHIPNHIINGKFDKN